ncbi:MAG: DUF4276 family protein [Pseudomonadota bacterium]
MLEESSAEAMLKALVPKLIDLRITSRYISFQGKQDLDKQLEKRLRGYLNPAARFIVMRDQDNHPECRSLKASLLEKCDRAGKASCALVRIACRELESFYLADLAAVEAGLGLSGLVAKQNKGKFRQPDILVSPSRELEKLSHGMYQKVGGSRAIGAHLDLGNTRSPSFHQLVLALRKMEQALLSELQST